MRTEIKLGLVIGLIVIGGGIFYAVNQGRDKERPGEIPFDVTVGQADNAGKIDLAADERHASGRSATGDRPTAAPAQPSRRPVATPRHRPGDDGQPTHPGDGTAARPSRARPLPPITRSPNDAPNGTSVPGTATRPALPVPRVAATRPAPATGETHSPAVVTPPRETVAPPGAARPTRLRDAHRPKPAATQYTIQRGDSLYAIAREHYGDGKYWTKIRDANPDINPDRLKIGQVITLPALEAPQDAGRESTGPAAAAGRATYVVEEGDTLTSTARHVLGDGSRWREIYELNKDRISDPDVVPVGIELKLPPIEKKPTP